MIPNEPPKKRTWLPLPSWLTPADATRTAQPPTSPFLIQENRFAANQSRFTTQQPQLSRSRYVAPSVREFYADRQARREIEEKALNIAEKAAMTVPIPFVGETVGVLGAGVSAGILGARAVRDARAGNYGTAFLNSAGAAAAVAGTPLANKAGNFIAPIAKAAVLPKYLPEADAGAAFTREWFRGRATAGLGGLTPADAAPLINSIKRPSFASVDMVPGAAGVYIPRIDKAFILPTAITNGSVETFAAHETAHQAQFKMRREVMDKATDHIKKTMPDGGLYQWGLYADENPFKAYANNPLEVHARIIQLRHRLGYKPDEVISLERFIADKYRGGDSHGINKLIGTDDNSIIVDWLNKLPAALPAVVGAGAVAAGNRGK